MAKGLDFKQNCEILFIWGLLTISSQIFYLIVTKNVPVMLHKCDYKAHRGLLTLPN